MERQITRKRNMEIYGTRVLVARGKTILGQESIKSYINYIFQELFIVLFSPSDFDSPFFFSSPSFSLR